MQARKYQGVWGCDTPQSCIQLENLRRVGKVRAVLNRPCQSENVKSFKKSVSSTELY